MSEKKKDLIHGKKIAIFIKKIQCMTFSNIVNSRQVENDLFDDSQSNMEFNTNMYTFHLKSPHSGDKLF